MQLVAYMVITGMTVGQTPGEIFFTNQKAHQIPIDAPQFVVDSISLIQLYTSTDLGLSWRFHGAIAPDKKFFNFRADNDGPYWFQVAVVDLVGRQNPSDISKGPPDQKMILDTINPTIAISARRLDDCITVTWKVEEANPDTSSLKLEWRTYDQGINRWRETPIAAG